MFWIILKGWLYLGMFVLSFVCLIGGFYLGTAASGGAGVFLFFFLLIASLKGSHG